ncbi:MAG: FKBP-type peptidyl-prolyl cis-trans isomerase [Prevotellaceae bacterium]|jgi:FKBP-type peptidyl-prolyl cis-trans isomerase|nr:FKBP-type peptidyl-prolyl cis-trans isomerase [Prevotellaceae bacterium]
MKHLIYLFFVALLAVSCNSKKTESSSSVVVAPDSVSYAIGVYEAYSTVSHLQGSNLKVNYDKLFAGYKSILNDDSIKAHDMQWASSVISNFFTQKVKDEGIAFLEENKKNDSVVVLPSGLQYKVIEEGTGISPAVSDTVNVIYTGTVTEGQTFDSSRGKAVKMPLSRMIPGWQEGVPLMKEGARYKFYIPSDLAYGNSGQFAGRVLIFDVELVSVLKGPELVSDVKASETE